METRRPTKIIEPPWKPRNLIGCPWMLRTDAGDFRLQHCAEALGIPHQTLYARVIAETGMGWQDPRALRGGRQHKSGNEQSTDGPVEPIIKETECNNKIDAAIKAMGCTFAKRRTPESIKLGSWERSQLCTEEQI